MLEALIAGERDPRRLAGLARGRMRVKHGALVEALTGRFDDHHAELTRMLLDQIDALSTQIATLTARIDELLTAMEPQPRPDQPHPPGGAGTVADGARESTTIERLDEIPGISPGLAQVILAEIGLDMSQFPTAAHLVSWAKLCPRTIQSGAIQRGGKTGKGNPYLKCALGEAAAAAAKTNTFLGERYRRIVKRRGKLKALVAVARSILVIIWNMLNDPTARFRDLGADYHTTRINTERRTRNYVTQLMARWATASPSNPPPDPNLHRHNTDPAPQAPPGDFACPLTLGDFPVRKRGVVGGDFRDAPENHAAHGVLGCRIFAQADVPDGDKAELTNCREIHRDADSGFVDPRRCRPDGFEL